MELSARDLDGHPYIILGCTDCVSGLTVATEPPIPRLLPGDWSRDLRPLERYPKQSVEHLLCPDCTRRKYEVVVPK